APLNGLTGVTVTIRPCGRFALPGPKITQESPMRGRGRAAPGEFRLEESLHALVRLVAFGQQLPGAFGPLAQPALRAVQENFLDSVAPPAALESHSNRGRQAGAGRLQSPDFLVPAGVA